MGICNREGLAGGPPSTDLTRELEGARSAIVFAFPLDEEKLEAYMGKVDHGPYQADYIRTNNIVQGVASELAHSLRGFGFEAVPVYAGNTPSGGDHRDVQPQNDEQREAARRHPARESDFPMGTVPVLSQRHLAAARVSGSSACRATSSPNRTAPQSHSAQRSRRQPWHRHRFCPPRPTTATSATGADPSARRSS